MSLHYLLDGYNIIHQIPALTLSKLEDQRRGLIRLIEHFQPQGSWRNKVTIVFDGRSEIYGRDDAKSVRVIFSREESADDKIKGMVQESDQRKNIVVVTNDREIKYAVGALGAQVWSVEDFLGKIKSSPSYRTPSSRTQTPVKNISKTVEFEINAELKEIWLKKNKP